MFDDIVDYLKLLIMIGIIGIWVYIVVGFSDFLSKLKIVPDILVGLFALVLFAGGTLLIILKLKDL